MIMLYDDNYVVEYKGKFYRWSGVDRANLILSQDDADDFIYAPADECLLYVKEDLSNEYL